MGRMKDLVMNEGQDALDKGLIEVTIKFEARHIQYVSGVKADFTINPVTKDIILLDWELLDSPFVDGPQGRMEQIIAEAIEEAIYDKLALAGAV